MIKKFKLNLTDADGILLGTYEFEVDGNPALAIRDGDEDGGIARFKNRALDEIPCDDIAHDVAVTLRASNP